MDADRPCLFLTPMIITEAVCGVIMNEAGCLHVSVDDRAAHETKPAFLEVLRKGIALGRRGWEVGQVGPSVDLWLAVDKSPDVRVKRAEFFLDLEEGLGIGDGRLDLETITNNAVVLEQFPFFSRIESRNFTRIKSSERLAVAFSSEQDGFP